MASAARQGTPSSIAIGFHSSGLSLWPSVIFSSETIVDGCKQGGIVRHTGHRPSLACSFFLRPIRSDAQDSSDNATCS